MRLASLMKSVLSALVAACSASAARAQDAEQFYRGETINLIVPSAGGGIFELSSQLVARHLAK